MSGRAWLQALLDFEAALARAQARARIISADDAEKIVAACDADRYDVAEIGAGAAEIGNPAGAVVKALKQATDAPVHHGATSQDAVDTAMMLVVKRALVPLLDDLRGAADAAATLAQAHRDTPIMGRTLLQDAKPTTVGLRAAGWMVSLDEAADNLHNVRLAYQLGGPVGTLEPLKLDLDLDAPLIPWHTLRGRVGELAGALGVACGAIGKAARDVTLMPEVRERVGGGSTSMPHKHNPVAAISALGCTRQAPGLVATLLAAMEQELERAAGAWHSEWAPLNQLLIATGSAASWLRTSLTTLEVHAALDDADTGAAAALVDRALEAR
ncbi:MAG TPA: lyase family protein [Solirubrobacter sp.]|nr:lyase family protein [Solirubrobacter sp.]